MSETNEILATAQPASSNSTVLDLDSAKKTMQVLMADLGDSLDADQVADQFKLINLQS
jgi:hypothetical protein